MIDIEIVHDVAGQLMAKAAKTFCFSQMARA